MAEARARGNSAKRRKLILAITREFAVDWWRLRTGRTTPEAFGLQMSWSAQRCFAPNDHVINRGNDRRAISESKRCFYAFDPFCPLSG